MRQMRFAAPLLLGLAVATMPVLRAHAQVVGITITVAPPFLPVYDQPPIPEPGYIWVPGYWAWSDAGYYWVPGTWILPPVLGLLWTPGYWGCDDNGYYIWHAGYWGPHVGFYGGVNYGYGYTGDGYQGGYWQQNHFYYNRAVNNFGGVHVTNVYEHNVTNVTVNRISYNGGHGGIDARPNQQDLVYQNEHHYGPTDNQMTQEHAAAGNRDLWASQNHGVPPIAATPRPADFSARGVEPARNAPVSMPAVAHPENATTPQHETNMMQPQRPAPQEPHVVGPENYPQNHEPAAPQAYHPQEMTPAVHEPETPAYHEPEPQPYHPQEMAPAVHEPEAPAYHEPAEQAYHPQEMAPAVHAPAPPAYHPAPAPHPEGAQPAYHPEGGNQEHKPN